MFILHLSFHASVRPSTNLPIHPPIYPSCFPLCFPVTHPSPLPLCLPLTNLPPPPSLPPSRISHRELGATSARPSAQGPGCALHRGEGAPAFRTESVSSPTVPCQVEGQASTPGVLLSLFSHHCPHPGGRNKPWAVWAGGRAGPGDPLCVPCTRLRSPRLPSQPLAWSTHVISRTSPAAEMSAVMRASVGPAHSPGTQGGAAWAPLGTERGASRMKVLGPTGPHVPGAT